ncbi:solute carrier family 49 member 4 homolog [Clavelina lepadiformis]|uniref:Major facilitator superfamily (MFS) profile domain-containing protein n=1 Tax=Clavelina lepadiformis TaxID=159417 RepID=A0ABP0EZ68_CLALP
MESSPLLHYDPNPCESDGDTAVSRKDNVLPINHNIANSEETTSPPPSYGSIDENKNQHLSSVYVKCQTYWYRWYICLIFSLLGFLQGAIWNTWSPIDTSAKAVYGFTSGDIELLTNWGPISFIVSMPFFAWLLEEKGLRVSCLSTAFLVALGTAVRCLPFQLQVMKYLMHLGQFFNGMGGCVVMATPPLLSNTWFPPNERITATGLSTLFNYLGTGGGYIVAEYVKAPSNRSSNLSCFDTKSLKHNDSCAEVREIRKEIMNVLYVECGIAVFVFLAMLIYFPKRPPLPPSLSASCERMDLKAGLKIVIRNKRYLVVALVAGLTQGFWGGWTGVMTLILDPLHVTQKEAGNIGFFMSLSGCVVGMFVGWITDRLKGKMKRTLVVLFALTLIMFIYFVIVNNQWLHFVPFLPQSGVIWAACIILGILSNASVPIAMEMAADAAYPVGEGTSTSILVWLLNISSFFFLLGLNFSPDPTFANYIMLGSYAIGLPLLILFTKEENRRLELDVQRKSISPSTLSSPYGSFDSSCSLKDEAAHA